MTHEELVAQVKLLEQSVLELAMSKDQTQELKKHLEDLTGKSAKTFKDMQKNLYMNIAHIMLIANKLAISNGDQADIVIEARKLADQFEREKKDLYTVGKHECDKDKEFGANKVMVQMGSCINQETNEKCLFLELNSQRLVLSKQEFVYFVERLMECGEEVFEVKKEKESTSETD